MTSNLIRLCKRAVVVLLLSTVAFGFVPGPSASAGEGVYIYHWDGTDRDGNDVSVVLYYKDGEYWAEYRNWTEGFGFHKCLSCDNPNPDDSASGLAPDDRQSVQALFDELAGLATDVDKDMMKTPLGDILIGNGGSIVPVWNPGEVWFEAEETFGGGHGGGFDPNSGPVGEQIGKLKNGGGSGGSPDGEGNDAHKEDYGFYDHDYAANPELVNPPKAGG